MQIITNKDQKEIKHHGNDQFPFLISEERLSKYECGSFLWHWHNEIELTLINKGEMIYKINNNMFHLHEGESLFGNTGTLHEGYMYENKDCNYTSITFDSKLIYGFDNSILYSKYVAPIIQDFSLSSIHLDCSLEWHLDFIDLLKDIILIYQEHDFAFEFDIIIKLQQLWKLLILNYNFNTKDTNYDKRNYDRIKDILSYIEKNYDSKLTLEDISSHIHLCKGECCRIFKRYMKVPLFDFILDYRIEKSLDKLINTTDSIQSIAFHVGFHDSNYYSKVFSKRKGCTPSQYRKNMTII